jgi:hypothetical protein
VRGDVLYVSALIMRRLVLNLATETWKTWTHPSVSAKNKEDFDSSALFSAVPCEESGDTAEFTCQNSDKHISWWSEVLLLTAAQRN